MARYDVSPRGADALELLSRTIIETYDNIIAAGLSLEKDMAALDNNNEIYSKIIDLSERITTTIRAEQDTFTLLASNIALLSAKVHEILGGVSTNGSQVILTEGFYNQTLGESPSEKAIVDKFYDDILNTKNLVLADPQAGQQQIWVNSRDILGVFHNDSVNADIFWSHHGETKERFVELVSQLEPIKQLLDQGVSIDQIKQIGTLAPCAEQYFSPKRAVRVYRYGKYYVFKGDGRHRVRIAQELGLSIPVIVEKEVIKKGGTV